MITINPKYDNTDWRKWLYTLPKQFEHSGTVIYDARNQLRLFTNTPNGATVVVKRYGIPMLWNRIVYTCFRKPKAMRAYDNALRLTAADIDTPEAIAYILEQHGGLITYSYLITKAVQNFRMLYEFGEHSIDGYEPIVRALAHFAAALHTRDIYHRDFSPGNILWQMKDGVPHFTLIDINRMSFGHVGVSKACRSFRRLWGNPPMMRLLAREYAAARGWNADRCEQLTLHYWRRFWRNRNPHFPLYDQQLGR